MSQDDSIYHRPYPKPQVREPRHHRHESRREESSLPDNYRSYSTLETKTQMSKILREMERGDYDGAIITSYGRRVGILFPDRLLRQKR